MEPADWTISRPWLAVATAGVRRELRWSAPYLRPMRLHFWLAYWNPTPGAAVRAAGRRWTLGPRSLLLIPAGAWFQREQARPCRHWWCHFRVEARPAAAGPWTVPVAGALAEQLQASWDAAWADGPGCPAHAAATHAALAIALGAAAWLPAPAAGADPKLQPLLIDLARREFPAESNGILAGRLGMHEKSFCRRFHQVVGQAPQAWLRERRLDLAAERLGQGMAVEEAAALGGFTDRFHFSRLFRRHRGLGPGLYRRLGRPG